MVKRFRALILTLLGVVMLAAGFTANPAKAAPTIINFYSSGDTNITDWLQNDVVPGFEKLHPEYQVKFYNTRASGIDPIVARAIAALQSNTDPQADFLNVIPPSYPDAMAAGLWYEPTVKDVPNLANAVPDALFTKYGIPYGGSNVLLAYNSDVIPEKEVPHTYPALIKWIKNHPGQFVYSRPDKGGSGGYFVARALYEVSGLNPGLWNNDNYDQQLVDTYYPLAMSLLAQLQPYIYGKGSYPAGNLPALKLFAAGEVSMVSAWSDQSLQSIDNGTLPKSTKLIQLSDLPMPGGYDTFAIPKNAANLPGALALANYILSPEVQSTVVTKIFNSPAIRWELLPKELQERFSYVVTKNIPLWPDGKFNAPLTKLWYNTVATNIDPNS